MQRFFDSLKKGFLTTGALFFAGYKPGKTRLNKVFVRMFFRFRIMRYGKRCGFSKRYFLVLVACRHLTCTKTECRKMFLSLIAPLTTIRLNRGKRSNRLPYIFAQGQER